MSEQKVGLLLRTVFLPPLDENFLAGNEITKTFDSDPDHSDIAPNLYQPIFQKAQENRFNKSARVADISWDQPFTAAPRAEVFTNPLNFSKSSMGYKLRVTRTEKKTVDGETWALAYSGDDLVDARVVNE